MLYKKQAESLRRQIEANEKAQAYAVIPLSDDDIPSLGRWREVVSFIRKRKSVVFFREVCEHLNLRGSCVSRILAQAVFSGKVRNLGHQKGWIATS